MSVVATLVIALCLAASARLSLRAHRARSIAPLGKAMGAALASIVLSVVFLAWRTASMFSEVARAPVEAKQLILAEHLSETNPTVALGFFGGGILLVAGGWLRAMLRKE
jgi:hypothetical protein